MLLVYISDSLIICSSLFQLIIPVALTEGCIPVTLCTGAEQERTQGGFRGFRKSPLSRELAYVRIYLQRTYVCTYSVRRAISFEPLVEHAAASRGPRYGCTGIQCNNNNNNNNFTVTSRQMM